MSCKYDIIDEDGRKRVRALRHFTVQGRDVCPMELGGYVYDANTLSQDGNCWIFSGSLEYPGVRVLDEAIVDMGNNLPKGNVRRPKATIISGNSRIMGAISFETPSFDETQTPDMFEQGGFSITVGSIPIKSNSTTRVRIPAQAFSGTAGKVAVTSTAYEFRVISLNEAGIVVSATAWTVGGPSVSISVVHPYFLVDLRKVGETAIVPADVTTAGVTITQAREATVRIFNSSIVPVYNGSVTRATSILRYEVTDPSGKPYQVNIQNSYLRIECVFNVTNVVRVNADFIKVNYNLVLAPNVSHYISGTFRNTNMNTPASVGVVGYTKSIFDVSDCPNFEFSTVTFPDLAAMYASGRTFYFKQCNMPAGSAIHYYDPKVNVWDNIDFTKAMADLGKTAFVNTTIVSSNVQGMYRARGNTNGMLTGLLEAASSFNSTSHSGTLADSYDSIIYKDCVLNGVFTIIGRNVFGGTLGGASKITNTAETAMVIDGNFRIEGNAQVTDTSLKGTGYIGGNAELKNGVVEGYIYLADNAKYTPQKAAKPSIIRSVIMDGNSKVTKQSDADAQSLKLEMHDNAVINAAINVNGYIIMHDNTAITREDAAFATYINGALVMRDHACLVGSTVTVYGICNLVGGFNLNTGARSSYGKRTVASPNDLGRLELPPTKTTW